MNIEPLESRIAPASVLLYTDIDGDKVKVTSSSATGDLNAMGIAILRDGPTVGLQQLTQLNLGPAFAGTNLTFTVTKVPGGDGLANVGYINSSGADLGKVTIKGDLGRIDAGDNTDPRPGVKTLKVRSLGRFGATSQPAGGDTTSTIIGTVETLQVAGDIVGAYFYVAGDILAVKVGGSVIGGSTPVNGTADYLGAIFAEQTLGVVSVKGDVIGGTGIMSGAIGAGADVKSLTVGGSVIGGSGKQSGMLYGSFRDLAGDPVPDTIGSIKIGHDLVGGTGIESGSVELYSHVGRIASVVVGGSIKGGTEASSGGIQSGEVVTAQGFQQAEVGSITVGGSIVGGTGKISGYLRVGDVPGKIAIGGSVLGGSAPYASGAISARNVGTVAIGGNLVGGISSAPATVEYSGVILVINMKTLTIRGSIIGGSGIATSDGSKVSNGGIQCDSLDAFSVKGSIVGNEATPVSIKVLSGELGSFTVGGRVEWAYLRTSVGPIGTVKVGGDWIASSLSSRVSAGGDGFFGNGDDSLANATNSRIASITIRGAIIGSANSSDSFAFTAHEIGSFKALGKTYPLTANTLDATVPFSAETAGDVKLREL